MINDDNFTPEEQYLIASLKSLPAPQMDADIFDAIKREVLHEMDQVPDSSAPKAKSSSLPLIIVMIIIIVIVTITLIWIANSSNTKQSNEAITKLTSTLAPANEASTTATLTNTPTILTPSFVATTDVILVMPTQTSTAINELRSGATEESPSPILVVEGPVQAINLNTITIFGIDIEFDSSTLADTIQVGDVIRVEGDMKMIQNQLIFVAVHITKINVQVKVSASTGAGSANPPLNLPPECKVSKKGTVKCKEKKSKKSK